MEAFAALHKERPRAKLLLVSLFEPERIEYHRKLRQMVAGLGIADAVAWTGHLDDAGVSRCLGSADVGFFPFQDGVSLRRQSFMTAMVHALPVVTTRGMIAPETLGLKHLEKILAKLKADPVLWNARIEAVRNVGLEAIEVAKKKDVEELWDVGGNLDAACENCHLDYWYPGQRGLLKKLQAKVQEATRDTSGRIPAPPGCPRAHPPRARAGTRPDWSRQSAPGRSAAARGRRWPGRTTCPRPRGGWRSG